MKGYDLPSRLPQLGGADYQQRLAVALEEWLRSDRRTLRELDHPPTLKVALGITAQGLSATVLTTIAFDVVVSDTAGWWDATTHSYTPALPGYYRATWALHLSSDTPLSTSTYASAQCGDGFVSAYANGVQTDIQVHGATTVRCDGTTALRVDGLLSAGAFPIALAFAAPYRTWLDIQYVGSI